MTIEELEIKIDKNISFIEENLDESNSPSADNIEEIVSYGMLLAAIISLTSRTLADSNELLRKKELIFMNCNVEFWNRPTILKKLMEGNLASYYSRVILADRLSAACTHKMDFYRSVISKHKEELRLQIQFNQK